MDAGGRAKGSFSFGVLGMRASTPGQFSRLAIGLIHSAILSRPKPKPVWPAVLLPSEHGSWSFVLDPPLWGLLMAPSLRGTAVVMLALTGFLAYRPLRLAARDLLAHKSYPRTRWAVAFATVLSCLTVVLSVVGQVGPAMPYWTTLATFCAIGIVFAIVDHRTRPGSLGRELIGAVMTIPLALTLVENAHPHPSLLPLAVAGLLAFKSVSTVLYVRARLAGSEGSAISKVTAVSVGILGVAFSLMVADPLWPAHIPTLAMLVLVIRAAWGMSAHAKSLAPKWVGIQEFSYSLMIVLFVGIGYWAFR